MSKRVKLNTGGKQKRDTALPPAVPRTLNRDTLKLGPPAAISKEEALQTLTMVMEVKNGQRSISEWENIVAKRTNPTSRMTFTSDQMRSSESESLESSESEHTLHIPAAVEWRSGGDPQRFVRDVAQDVSTWLRTVLNSTRTPKEWTREFFNNGLALHNKSKNEVVYRLEDQSCFVGCVFETTAGRETLKHYCFIPFA